MGPPLLKPGTLSDSKARNTFNDYCRGYSSSHDSDAFCTLRRGLFCLLPCMLACLLPEL